MSGDQNGHDGLRRAANVARAAHIAAAAATSGIYGAAIATAKEALPFIIKAVIALIAFPILIFAAVPNMFFGYDSSDTEEIVAMTEQAHLVGTVYISMRELENTLIDSVVTAIVTEYEQRGIEFDRVEVDNRMNEEDLCWIIAINSVVHQQNLDEMSANTIRDFVKARLDIEQSLFSGESTTVLKITIKNLDSEKVMDELGFDKEGKTWAGTLYETIEESDALDKYASEFDQYIPDYGGDTGGSWEPEHGTKYDNTIDTSKFISPGTKNNLDLAQYAIQAFENNWGYVWGTFGTVLTRPLLDYKAAQYPNGVGDSLAFIESHWLGRRTTDCIGLIKGYAWLDTDTMTHQYGTNGMPDYSADAMYQAAARVGTRNEDYGSMGSLPEIPGVMLHKRGHVGVYIGGGYAIEASSTRTGVVKTKVAGRGWENWCKLPYIEYWEE